MATQSSPARSPQVRTRMIIVGIIISCLFGSATFFWILPSAEEALLARKRDKIKEATEIAWNVLRYFHQKESAGDLTRARAQEMAVALIQQTRFGPELKDYFWINDRVPRIVMHPFRKNLGGKDVSAFSDHNGKALFVESVKIAEKNGEGFIDFMWPWKDDPERIVPKIGYVRLFRPWGWILGTGMYVEDIHTEIRNWKYGIIAFYLVLALVGIVLSAIVGQQAALALRRTLTNAPSDPSSESGQGESSRGLTLSLRSFVLTVMIPLLLCLTLYWSIDLYRDLRGIILRGFDAKLSAVSSTVGLFIPGEDHRTVEIEKNEQSPIYEKMVNPMESIMAKMGLTYLYTQTLSDTSNHCWYILDATEGEDHSDAGTMDELDAEDYRAAQNVARHGVVYTSDVYRTDNWGLLKFAYAPIFNRDGTVQAMAGADVNIEAVRMKTRVALFSAFLMALAAIGVGGYLSLLATRAFTKPIGSLKEWALKVAAGLYESSVSVESPKEFRELANEFSQIGIDIVFTLNNLQTDFEKIAHSEFDYRLISDLDRRLDRDAHLVDSGADWQWINNKVNHKSASGDVKIDGNRVVWIAYGQAKPFEAVRVRNDIGALLTSMSASSRKDAIMPHAEFAKAYSQWIRALLVGNARDGSWTCFSNGRVGGLVRNSDGSMNSLSMNASGPIEIAPKQKLYFWDAESITVEALKKGCEEGRADPLRQLAHMAGEQEKQVFLGVLHEHDAH